MNDFKTDAVDFVRRHNCVNSTPVELIQEAMLHGANEALKATNEKLKLVADDLDRKHRESAPHSHPFKPIAALFL